MLFIPLKQSSYKQDFVMFWKYFKGDLLNNIKGFLGRLIT